MLYHEPVADGPGCVPPPYLMQRLQGIAVSPGVAIGEALIIDYEGFRIPRRFVARDAVQDELERLRQAIEAVGREIERNRDAVASQLGDQYGAIFSAHLQILVDQRLNGQLTELIREQHYSPEYAVSRTLRQYAKVFQSLDNSPHAELANDIFDIEQRLLRNLLGRPREELSQLSSPVIVLAHSLTPSEAANLDRDKVLGFATETGGPGGHTAIVAEALELPAVVGTGRFLADVSGGELVIVDGDQGQVILRPDEETIARYRHEVEEHRALAVRLELLRDLPATTADGTPIQIDANIEFPGEVEACAARGAQGIGLYRTEFLFLNCNAEPDEEVHYQAYARVIHAMKDLPVVIRTVDLGADKIGAGLRTDQGDNPELGLRSIRLSLRNLPQFRTQLRAVLRASAIGNVRLMFPLITTLQELRRARAVLAEVMQDLEDEAIPFDRNLSVGMMVEVPGVVIMLERFLEEVDFISIGTNDLIQYALAVDRGNRDVVTLYNAGDPAVLRLIDLSLTAARRADVPAALCGQMSGNTIYAMILLGLGLRQFSVPPSAILEIKKITRSVTLSQCQALARRAMQLDNACDVNVLLKDEMRKVAPELALFA